MVSPYIAEILSSLLKSSDITSFPADAMPAEFWHEFLTFMIQSDASPDTVASAVDNRKRFNYKNQYDHFGQFVLNSIPM